MLNAEQSAYPASSYPAGSPGALEPIARPQARRSRGPGDETRLDRIWNEHDRAHANPSHHVTLDLDGAFECADWVCIERPHPTMPKRVGISEHFS